MDNRYEIAEQNGMSREFADWFFDNKKAGCGNVWFMMMAAMWEGWQGRAAMLQGAGRPQNEPQNIPENIPATQFKPVADLYEVTVPSGRSTTFTKDAAEASDCRVMGWSVQEYVKLERYQAAMLHGAEPVSQPDELPMDYLQGHKDGLEWAARLAEANHPQTGDWLYDDPLELAKAIRKGPDMPTSPVQGWIPCSERMPQKNERVIIFINFNSETVPPSIHDAQFTGSTFRRGNATVNVFPLEDGYGVTHWMPLPEAPKQEA